MSRRSFLTVLAAALVTVLVVASRALLGGRDARAEAPRPPEIRYGRDACDRCNMIINDERFAAAYRSSAGEARRFDDLGEMVLELRSSGAPAAAAFVHDHRSRAWLPAERAHYVRSARIASPMGFGFAAFEDEAAARAYAAEQEGEILDWRQLMTAELKPTPAPAHGHGK